MNSNPVKFKKTLLCSVFALSSMVATTAIAAEDVNPATAEGQAAIKKENKEASFKTPSNPFSNAKVEVKGKEVQPEVHNHSVEEAVENCELIDSQPEALAEAIRIATEVKPNIDDIFNPKDAQGRPVLDGGCFAASSQVMNLAAEIPSMNLSWSNLGNVVKNNINKMLDKKTQELMAKGCEIADQALLSTLLPVQDYLNEYQSRSYELQGILGNFGVTANTGDPARVVSLNPANDYIVKKINGSLAKISENAEKMKDIERISIEKFGKGTSAPVVNETTFGGSDNPLVLNIKPDELVTSDQAAPTPAPAPTQPAANNAPVATPTTPAPAPKASGSNPYSSSQGGSSSSTNPY